MLVMFILTALFRVVFPDVVHAWHRKCDLVGGRGDHRVLRQVPHSPALGGDPGCVDRWLLDRARLHHPGEALN